jgi:para-nitrobenzyl esterase
VTSAEHASELAYLFDQMEARYGKAVTDKDRAMARTFHRYFVNFAKSGDPNGAGLAAWPMFDPAAFELMHFTLDDGPVFGSDPRAARLELVERAADARAAGP